MDLTKIPPQAGRVMRLTAIILFTCCMAASARGFTQKITLKTKDASLAGVLHDIEKQSGYQFLFFDNDISLAKPVSIDLREADITEALQQCFKDQPLLYEIADKTIVIKLKNTADKKPEENHLPPPADISGIVTDENGIPLSGATVIIKSTGKGTVTDAKGRYLLKGNLTEKTVLVVSFIGYSKQEITIEGNNFLPVSLKPATSQLDEAVVQAYGKTTQRLTTSNIAKVTAAEIERQPVMNPLLALQGKVAGLDITQTSGFASAPVKVELRGRNIIGINSGQTFPADPLYIIDGVPLSIVEIGGNSSYNNGSTGFLQTGGGFNGPASGQSPLFSINPSDIESIEVLKDADATAIYGSRAANGVILITTKKGKAGKTNFDMSIQEGITRVTRFWDLLNTQQYLEMRKEALKNDQITPDQSNGYDLLSWDTTRYTNWQKILFGKAGKTINVQAALSGGDIRTTFRVSAGYDRTTDITTVSGASQRFSIGSNFTHRSSNQRLSISLTSNYSYAEADMINFPDALTLPPNAPAIYDSAGNLNYAGWGIKNSAARRSFPFAKLKQFYTTKTNFLNANLMVSYELFKGLAVSTSFGYNTAQTNQQQLTPIASLDPASVNLTGSATFGYNSNKNWLIEPQLEYNLIIGRGKLNILVGGTSQKTSTNGLSTGGTGYTSDALLRSISNAPNKSSFDNFGEYRYAAAFGKINYNWENKYILNLTARRDGSSNFGENKQYGNFASLGAAWIFTEENWFKNNISFLSFGKLRSSYGTTGSDAVSGYQYLTRWSSSNAPAYGGIAPILPTQHANPDFQWQVNKKFEAALELGFFRDQIHLSTAYYRNRCGNQLVGFPTPPSTGFPVVTANSPALVQNDGWEFLLSASIINTRNFKWSVNFNTSFNRNKLVAYPNFELSPFLGQLVIGKSLNTVQLLHYTGVNPQNGQYTFEDKNHNGNIDVDFSGKTVDDRYAYNLSPKFFGGLGMNFGYKNLQINLTFSVKKQLGRNAYNQGDYPGRLLNQPVGVLSRWQKEGDLTTVARFTTQGTYDLYYFKGYSDGAYTDASFIRLSNLSVSYSIPGSLIKKMGIQSCNLFFNTNNLFVITSYKGIDPETQNFQGLPPTKIIVGGISFHF